MDNVCHALVGATIGYSFKPKKIAYAPLIGMVAANIPDVDVLAVAFGDAAMFTFRRGWTHGVPALLVWPWILAGLAWWWTGRRGPQRDRQEWWSLLFFVSVAVVSHPLLDFMNVYGMRWLMPFSGEWFYGDVLFIVDPWIWAVLAGGVFVARRHGSDIARQAQAGRRALLGAAAYLAVMVSLMFGGRAVVRGTLHEIGASADARMMVGPVPLNPFRQSVVVETSGGYRIGEVRWTPIPKVSFSDSLFERDERHPSVRRALATPEGRAFMDWARFPFFIVNPMDSTVVHIVDARYALDTDARFGTMSIQLE
ncbi:MAG: metal-dependent hydrolase [Gemmatimonadota bacterium]|nr:metal-dependent hydrolase [Gemmatimonadota bacterium]MDH5804863.1 metal-dependent hydrolase [Gemmatimonadota bacterium]